MSTSSKAAERGAARRRGFTLVEVLVALVVASLVLPALARALSGAWSASRMPMDVISAVTLARDVAAGGSVPEDARRQGYAASRTGGPVTLLVLPSRVAPAPGGPAGTRRRRISPPTPRPQASGSRLRRASRRRRPGPRPSTWP